MHGHLDKALEKIKAGTVSRKELIEQLVGKGLNESTIKTQCGVWARNNSVVFARPEAAAEAKKDERKSKRTKAAA